MAKKNTPKEKPVEDASEVTFTCKFCGETKPFSELVLQTRYFPLLISCRDCEKHMAGMSIEETTSESDEVTEEEEAETDAEADSTTD